MDQGPRKSIKDKAEKKSSSEGYSSIAGTETPAKDTVKSKESPKKPVRTSGPADKDVGAIPKGVNALAGESIISSGNDDVKRSIPSQKVIATSSGNDRYSTPNSEEEKVSVRNS
jgi:hypothetical protein